MHIQQMLIGSIASAKTMSVCMLLSWQQVRWTARVSSISRWPNSRAFSHNVAAISLPCKTSSAFKSLHHHHYHVHSHQLPQLLQLPKPPSQPQSNTGKPESKTGKTNQVCAAAVCVSVVIAHSDGSIDHRQSSHKSITQRSIEKKTFVVSLSSCDFKHIEFNTCTSISFEHNTAKGRGR